MIKNIILLLSIVPILALAQFNNKDYKVSTSEAYKVIDASSKYYFSRGNDVMMLKFNRDIIIQKYDADRKKEVSRKEYPSLPKGAVRENVLEIGGNYYIFYSLWDKSKELEQLYYVPLNFENGTMGKAKRLISIKGKLAGSLAATGFYRFGVVDKFDFYTSYDDSKLMIKYRKKPKKTNDKISYDVFGSYILDGDLSELWSGEIKMPYTEAEMNNRDFTVDGNGTAYMLAEVYDSEVSKKWIKGEKNYHLELLKIVKGDVEIIEFDKDDLNINSIWINESKENKIYLAGYYNTQTGYQADVDGVFLMSVDESGDIEYTNTYEIPLEVLNMYEKRKTQAKNKKKQDKDKLDFEDLDLDKIYYMEDGSIMLIGEQYYVRSYTYTNSNGSTTTRYVYYYEDLLVTKINSDGELEWMKKIPKKQKGGSPYGGMGYTHMEKNGNHYFFFLDHIDNLDLKVNAKQRPKYHSDGLGGIYTVVKINDDSGDIKKSAIVNMKEIPYTGSKKPIGAYQFSTGRILETESGLIFETYKKGKEDIMIHVDFE